MPAHRRHSYRTVVVDAAGCMLSHEWDRDAALAGRQTARDGPLVAGFATSVRTLPLEHHRLD